jgi:transcriptional regulator with XRE-family HTH domain
MAAVVLRAVIGDVLRREVSDSARVSLGYLSEVERGRKEASSELLSAICAALDVPLSRVLCDAGTEMACQEAVERSAGAVVAAAQGAVGRPVVMAVA